VSLDRARRAGWRRREAFEALGGRSGACQPLDTAAAARPPPSGAVPPRSSGPL